MRSPGTRAAGVVGPYTDVGWHATEEGLTDADVARITEIVTNETGLEASDITIIQAQP